MHTSGNSIAQFRDGHTGVGERSSRQRVIDGATHSHVQDHCNAAVQAYQDTREYTAMHTTCMDHITTGSITAMCRYRTIVLVMHGVHICGAVRTVIARRGLHTGTKRGAAAIVAP